MANMKAEDIIEKLKPNAYHDEHPIWRRVTEGLNKMSQGERNNLWIIIACKHEEK